MYEAVQPDTSITGRMIRAARLEEAVYEEVEHDQNATRQAAIVVVGTSIAAGIGSGLAIGLGGLIIIPIVSVFAWALYAYITYFIGTRIFAGPETEADWGQLARTLGFASAPRALMVIGVVPALAALVGIVVGIWVLVTTVVALRAALDFTTGRAIGTAIVGWFIQGIVLVVVFALLA